MHKKTEIAIVVASLGRGLRKQGGKPCSKYRGCKSLSRLVDKSQQLSGRGAKAQRTPAGPLCLGQPFQASRDSGALADTCSLGFGLCPEARRPTAR